MPNLRRAILVDPHPLWLDAVSSALRSEIEVVATSHSTTHVVDLVAELQPDVVVTEIGPMPVDEYVRRIKEACRSVKVIVLTSDESFERIDEALAGGAVAYVIKTARPDDLSVAVRQAFSHSVFLPSGNGNGNGAAPRSAEPATPEHNLTGRELEILLLVAEGESNASVAQQLWVTEQTVKFHLSNTYKKLGVANRTQAAHWAAQAGLLDPSSTAAA